MSYEKSAITDTQSANPSLPPVQMREEREINPYRVAQPRINHSVSGQPDINAQPAITEETKSDAVKTEETVTLSPQMAALARKEQKFRQQEQDLKKRAQALEAEKLEIAELKALKTKLAAKDYSGIEDLVKYDEYTNYLINKDSELTPEQKALKELSDKVDSVQSAHQEETTKRFEAAVNERRKAVNELVASNADFSSIKELKAEEAVIQHILSTWEHDNIDLSPEEAAKEVEELLIERGAKWSSLTKLKNKLDPNIASEEKKQLPPLKAPIKTLTNNMASTGEVKRVNRPLSQMSDTERYAEARRRAEEKLKQGIRQ